MASVSERGAREVPPAAVWLGGLGLLAVRRGRATAWIRASGVR